MIKALYYLKVALKSISRNKFLSVVRWLTTFFCMTVVIFLTTLYIGGWDFIRQRSDYTDIEHLNMYVCQREDELPKNLDDITHYEFWAYNNRVLYKNKYISGVGFALTDIEFSKNYKMFLQYGRYITDAETECVVGYEISKKNGVFIDDEIEVGYKKYKIVGITDNAGFRDTILLCDSQQLDVGYPRMFFSDKTIFGKGITYHGVQIKDYYFAMNGVSRLIPFVVACTFMLFFSVLTVLNIMIIYRKKMGISNYVNYCVGASNRIIFLILFIENSIISVTAACAAYLCLAIFKDAVSIIFSSTLIFSLGSFLLSLIMSLTLALGYSLGHRTNNLRRYV